MKNEKNTRNAADNDGKKKSKGLAKKVTGATIFVALIAALISLLGHFGIGFGDGLTLSKKSSNSDTVAEEQADEKDKDSEATTADNVDYLELTVSESSYIYRNSEYTLDDLVKELLTVKDIKVKIRDDNASKSAYDSLTEALDENKITYVEESEPNE